MLHIETRTVVVRFGRRSRGLTGPVVRRRPFAWASALVLVLVPMLVGCAGPDEAVPSSPSAAGTHERWIDGDAQQRLVDALVETIACQDRDEYHDDLTSWAAMRGTDCVDASRTVTIRAYASSRAASQALATRTDVPIDGRGVRHGEHWFVAGPEDRIARLRAPHSAPESPHRLPAPTPTAREAFLTDCGRYTLDEATRMIRRESVAAEDGQDYQRTFPGVAASVRASITPDELSALRATKDDGRWHPMLSSHGPSWKVACRAAMTTHPGLGSSGEDG